MVDFGYFFKAYTGIGKTHRTYLSVLRSQVERSYPKLGVESLSGKQKQQILSLSQPSAVGRKFLTWRKPLWRSTSRSFLRARLFVSSWSSGIKVDIAQINSKEMLCQGLRSRLMPSVETGQKVLMSLKAIFIPAAYAPIL
jgi:hypothetical protein